MPKELTHWITAEHTSGLVSEGVLQKAIVNHPHFYYLGAVVYDSPFYADAVGGTNSYARVADVLHGRNGADTFEPYRVFFSAFSDSLPPEALSFICGAFTHYSLDVAFHPLVTYFSGEYFDDNPRKQAESQIRHRQFESLLDLYTYGAYKREKQRDHRAGLGLYLLNGGRFSRTLSPLLGSEALLSEIVEKFFAAAEERVPVVPMLKQHALLQRQFFNRFLSSMLNGTGKLLGGKIAVTAATFYPSIRGRAIDAPETALPFFSQPISYMHPNTGETLRASVDELLNGAAETAAELINGYQHAIDEGRGGVFLRDTRGLSLEFGCDTVKYPEPRHFDTDTPVPALCRKPAASS